ncbi:MAG: YraN family protein [Brevinematales bacterium]|nr:YraN family protein [Brevinematales bacterium]
MTANKLKTGKIYENLAKEYLLKKGYLFLTQNYKTRYGEIDLIFKDNAILVIVEVKYRKKNKFFDITNSVNTKKIKRILKTTEIYITENKIDFEEIRIDTVFIEKIGDNYKISHFINWS